MNQRRCAEGVDNNRRAGRRRGNQRQHGHQGVATPPKRTKAPLPRWEVCGPRGVLQPVCGGFRKLLRRMRELKRWSLDDLAGITHLSKQYHHELETDAGANPSLDVLSRVAAAFQVDLGMMMDMARRCCA